MQSAVANLAAVTIGWIKFPYLWLRYGSPVKADETVVLFPQSASVVTSADRLNSDNTTRRQWTVPVHAWVVEKEDGALSRLLGRHSVLSFLDLLLWFKFSVIQQLSEWQTEASRYMAATQPGPRFWC